MAQQEVIWSRAAYWSKPQSTLPPTVLPVRTTLFTSCYSLFIGSDDTTLQNDDISTFS